MNEWYQQQLTAPDVLECNVRIGLVPDAEHAQAMVELRDPVTNILIAQWSSPHVHSDQWLSLVELAVGKAVRFIGDAFDPF